MSLSKMYRIVRIVNHTMSMARSVLLLSSVYIFLTFCVKARLLPDFERSRSKIDGIAALVKALMKEEVSPQSLIWSLLTQSRTLFMRIARKEASVVVLITVDAALVWDAVAVAVHLRLMHPSTKPGTPHIPNKIGNLCTLSIFQIGSRGIWVLLRPNDRNIWTKSWTCPKSLSYLRIQPQPAYCVLLSMGASANLN